MADEITKFVRRLAEDTSRPDERCGSCGGMNPGTALRCRACGQRTPTGVQFLYVSFEAMCRSKKVFYHLLEVAGILGLVVGAYFCYTRGWGVGLFVLVPAAVVTALAMNFFREVAGVEDELKRHGVDPWRWRDG